MTRMKDRIEDPIRQNQFLFLSDPSSSCLSSASSACHRLFRTHMTNAIEVHDLTVAYRDAPVLWDIDLRVPAGVLMAVVGPNGAGKTTLIKSILGLVRSVSGEVLVDGKPYSPRTRA